MAISRNLSPVIPTKAFEFADGTSVDAFGRARVTTPFSIFEGQQVHGDGEGLTWHSILTGAGAYAFQEDEGSTKLSVTTANGDKARRISYHPLRFQPGKSHLLMFSFNFESLDINVAKRVGYFDANDGIYFEGIGSIISFVRTSSTTGSKVVVKVAQDDWNLDKMNGTGSSEINLDFTKTQLFLIDYQFPCVGRIRLGFFVNGILHYCHEFTFSDESSIVYAKNAGLYITYEIENLNSTNQGSSIRQMCASGISEGGIEPLWAPYVASSDDDAITIGTTWTALLSLRPFTTNGRVILLLDHIHTLNTGNNPIITKILYNASLTDPVWVAVGSNSVAEIDTSATDFSGGKTIHIGYVESGKAQGSTLFTKVFDIKLSNKPDFTDTITIIARSTATTTDIRVSLDWKELL